MSRRWIVGITLAGLVLGGGFAWARPGVVKTRAGASYEGEIDEKTDSVIVTMHGVQSTLQRDQVASIDYATSFDDQYKERLAKIGEKDAQGRIALARYAFDNRKYPQAEDLLQQAIAIDPSNTDATSLLETVRVQARLDATRGAASDAARPADSNPATPVRTSPGVQERVVLTPDEINYIRQSELRPVDTNTRMSISQELKRKFAISANMTYAQFNAMSSVDQALEILRKGDDDIRKQVRIMTDPSALAVYKSTFQPILLTGCATSGCHGGVGSGGFALFSPANTDSASYANFILLQRYTKSFGEGGSNPFGGAPRRMIDRGKGSYSILTQFALPPDVSDIDHPHVDGSRYNGIFRGKNDQRYQDLVAWIDGLNLPEQDYGSIKIPGPARMSTTSPAVAPTPSPPVSPEPKK